MKLSFIVILLLSTLNIVYGQQCHNDSTGQIPITDLGTNLFNGMQGGLYGNGENTIPQSHLNSGIQMASQVMPLDARGNYSDDGKIGFISMGMSNANMFFAGLRDSANAYPSLNSKLTLVNGATGGFDIDDMLDTTSQYWVTLNQKLDFAGITNEQVQVIWFMQAKHISGIPPNEGIEHIEIMEAKFLEAFHYFKLRFPNLKQIYCSGRDYGGYSQPGRGNPEPFSYYTNWAFRKLVERQINGDTALTYTGSNTKTAWLGWANNVWADGKNYRSDGFNWRCPDDVIENGVHPSDHGKAKVASLLFNFFKSDTTSHWFREMSLTSTIEITEINNVVKIYPNPTNNLIIIEPFDCESGRIELISRDGSIIRATNNNVIDVSSFSSGLYFIRVFNQDKISHGKFIKQ